jgi:uncharacterized phiE125 gp8 family phage protein
MDRALRPTMLQPVLTTAPASEPVTLDEAKAWLWVEHSADDTLIGKMISTAVARLDGYYGILGRAMINQTWRQDFTDWKTEFRLPLPNVSSITSITYFDASNTQQTVSASLYELLEDSYGSYVRFRDAFTSPALYDDRIDVVKVTFVAGYGATAANVPAPLQSAICMIVAHLYANRSAVSEQAMQEIPLGVQSLLMPYVRKL